MIEAFAMPMPRFRIRTLMIAVAVVALLCVPGVALVRWYTRPKLTARWYSSQYVAPDGKVWRGAVIYVRSDGAIFVE